MSPQVAIEEQIERYRRMISEARLRIALDLQKFSGEIARGGIRNQFLDADEAKVNRLLRLRLEATYRRKWQC